VKFPSRTLDRLADLIVNGDVVFFAGAGFSIDVEGNSAWRLIRRLLIRLYAFTSPAVFPECQELRTSFTDTFLRGSGEISAAFPFDEASTALREQKIGSLAQLPTDPPFPFDKTSAGLLAGRYYEINDWFVNAFGYLLRNDKLAPDRPPAECVANRLTDTEKLIQRSFPDEPVALEPIDSDLILWARKRPDHPSPGKALFLDTLGFRNAGIMRGRFQGPPPASEEEMFESVERLFHCALLPRHRVIARFAREGWCPTTITTNYDLLLEGAYRLAGFATKREQDEFPRTRFHRFVRIASPVEFFTDGKALRVPVLLKMHGCAERYRSWSYKEILENDARREEFKAYLRSMVFTYREIQNWRQDSWAADFLRTQLRTRTVVFCGYSLQDPVIHDTFRTVYEEMGRTRRSYEAAVVASPPEETVVGLPRADESHGPAFFFAPGDKDEFYGSEVLRAATYAVGARNVVSKTHPNYLHFHFRGGDFPNVDEQFSWLYHRAVRRQQSENLENDLNRIASLWLGKPRPDDDLRAIKEAFRAITDAECAASENWSEDRTSLARPQFQRITAWTDQFLAGLLREFSCGELVQRHRGPGSRLARLRRTGWYYPVMENPHWTGWAAVVEIALRRMAAEFANKASDFAAAGSAGPEALLVGKCDRPTVLYSVSDKRRARRALTIHYAGFGLRSRQAPLVGAVLGRTFWELRPSDARWYSSSARSPLAEAHPRCLSPGSWSVPAPGAGFIWRWAAGRQHDNPSFRDVERAREWTLGVEK